MKRLMSPLVGISIICMFLSGCATVISKDAVSRANRAIAANDVIKSPETYKGDVIVWGGEIIAATNRKEGTVLQVLQKPVDVTLRPKKVDQSAGRFLAIYDGYLDVAIYEPGRQVTVAGHIQAIRVLPLGGIEYTYPVVGVEEIHLWEFRKERLNIPIDIILIGIISRPVGVGEICGTDVYLSPKQDWLVGLSIDTNTRSVLCC